MPARVLLALIVVGCAWSLAAASAPVSAAASGTGFCEGQVLRDYLGPLERMPKLPALRGGGRLPFAAANVAVDLDRRLLAGGGRAGFSLGLRHRRRRAHPNWTVTATLARVDWRGRRIRRVGRIVRRVRKIDRRTAPSFRFHVGGTPAAYRLIATFRSPSGRRLGRFGAYYRVVKPTEFVRLTPEVTTYRPGETAQARLENFGSEPLSIGVDFGVERWDGSAWVPATGAPVYFPAIGYRLPAGGTSPFCFDYAIPADAAPGSYRIAKRVYFPASAGGGQRRERLYAEFEVLP